MGKANDPYAGLHLTDQTPVESNHLDQRLFAPSLPSKPSSVPTIDPPQVSDKTTDSAQVKASNQGTLETSNQGKIDTSNQGSLEPFKPPTKERTKVEEPQGSATRFNLGKTPDRANTYSFTEAELWAIEDVQQSLQRNHGIDATKYDIVRCGVHLVVEDFLEHGHQSQVAQRMNRRRSR